MKADIAYMPRHGEQNEAIVTLLNTLSKRRTKNNKNEADGGNNYEGGDDEADDGRDTHLDRVSNRYG